MRTEIEFPEELTGSAASAAAADAVATQRSVCVARTRALEGQAIILHQRKLQTEDEIVGIKAVIESQDKLIRTITEEADDLDGLLKKGLTTRERVLVLRRRQAELEGERAANIANVARARKAISEIDQQIVELSTHRINEAVAELSQVEAELFDLQQQIRSSEDVLARLEVRAPVSGTVVGLQFHTPGGVLQPGQPIMEIVPNSGALVVEVQVRPEDINLIAAGQLAQMRITAFNRFDLPPLDGTVQLVSADRVLDERTGNAYFKAVVTIDEAEVGKLGGERLMSGMSAEVMIRTGTRTMVAYLSEPVTRNFRRALRED
jgi:HlyD family type I secretion membrane fusion protein